MAKNKTATTNQNVIKFINSFVAKKPKRIKFINKFLSSI